MLRVMTLGLAAVVFASGAVAPSTVTAYGVVDNNVGWGKGSITSLKRLGTGGYLGSRLGFRGTEDLGDGLRAVFLLEHGYNSDDGTATATFWNRQAYVGLAGGWGELLLGRQYTPTFLCTRPTMPSAREAWPRSRCCWVPSKSAQAANIRANDAVSYRTPATLGGFSVQAMSTDHTASPGWYHGIKAGYAGGALSVDLALGHYNNPAIGDLDSVTVGGRYNWAPFKFYALFNKANSGSGNDSRGLQVSGAYTRGHRSENLGGRIAADLGRGRRHRHHTPLWRRLPACAVQAHLPLRAVRQARQQQRRASHRERRADRREPRCAGL